MQTDNRALRFFMLRRTPRRGRFPSPEVPRLERPSSSRTRIRRRWKCRGKLADRYSLRSNRVRTVDGRSQDSKIAFGLELWAETQPAIAQGSAPGYAARLPAELTHVGGRIYLR